MRASTERTIMTLFTLAILGVGAFWVWRNVLPAIAQGLQEAPTTPAITPTVTPTPAVTPPPPTTLNGGLSFGGLQSLLESVSLAFSKGFSGPGTKALLDQGKEGVSPSPAATTDAYLSHVLPWTGLTGYPTTEYDPAVWARYYEEREKINIRNI